jgi:hypothetical protein
MSNLDKTNTIGFLDTARAPVALRAPFAIYYGRKLRQGE